MCFSQTSTVLRCHCAIKTPDSCCSCNISITAVLCPTHHPLEPLHRYVIFPKYLSHKHFCCCSSVHVCDVIRSIGCLRAEIGHTDVRYGWFQTWMWTVQTERLDLGIESELSMKTLYCESSLSYVMWRVNPHCGQPRTNTVLAWVLLSMNPGLCPQTQS